MGTHHAIIDATSSTLIYDDTATQIQEANTQDTPADESETALEMVLAIKNPAPEIMVTIIEVLARSRTKMSCTVSSNETWILL